MWGFLVGRGGLLLRGLCPLAIAPTQNPWGPSPPSCQSCQRALTMEVAAKEGPQRMIIPSLLLESGHILCESLDAAELLPGCKSAVLTFIKPSELLNPSVAGEQDAEKLLERPPS